MRTSLIITSALVATLLVPAPAQATAIARPATPRGLPTAIEPLAHYVGQVSCDPVGRSGTVRLARLLMTTYRGTYAGTGYPCGTNGPVSEHYDGRAVDWMVSVRKPVENAEAKTLLSWLLATDRAGNTFAMARRLGVQYLIYNNRIWGSWNHKWVSYENCARRPQVALDSTCHRNHVHISLSWNGAIGHTSFWSKQVSAFDYGPCRTRDLNWAASRRAANLHECTYYPRVKAPGQASATKRLLLRYSGAGLIYGRTGPIVTVLQTALHVPTTGRYTLVTKLAVVSFQVRHHLLPTGTMNVATWRMLLRFVR